MLLIFPLVPWAMPVPVVVYVSKSLQIIECREGSVSCYLRQLLQDPILPCILFSLGDLIDFWNQMINLVVFLAFVLRRQN